MKNKYLKTSLEILIIATLFTGLDFLFHYFVPYFHIDSYAEPQFLLNIFNNPLFWYSTGKFLFTLFIGGIALFFLQKTKLNIYLKSLILTLIVVLPLQLRYILTYTYGTWWHISVISLHFVILYLVSLLTLRIFKKW